VPAFSPSGLDESVPGLSDLRAAELFLGFPPAARPGLPVDRGNVQHRIEGSAAAEICGCAVGTVKSRVLQLLQRLGLNLPNSLARH
jgi:hypothetical protein